MKILSLNTWGGKLYEPLMAYIKHQSKTVDVFCFQEVFRSRTREMKGGFRSTLFSDIARLLPEYRGLFCLLQKGYGQYYPVTYDLSEGIVIFIRRTIPARAGHFFIRGSKNAGMRHPAHDKKYPRAVQYIAIPQSRGESLVVANVQGMWWPGDKRDTLERLKQSKNILAGLSRLKGQKILMGDFNLMPDTESIRMIERAGYRNLISEYGIKDTRGEVNHALYPDSPQMFADYAFVSPEVKVKKFEVPHVNISDHLPLILTI